MPQASLKNNLFPRSNVVNRAGKVSVTAGIEILSGFNLCSTDIKFHNTRFKVGDAIVVSSNDQTGVIDVVVIQEMIISEDFSDLLFCGKRMSMIYNENFCVLEEIKFNQLQKPKNIG
jgi:hypothetical protein